MTHSESPSGWVDDHGWAKLASLLNADEEDAQLLIWGPAEDFPTAVETIEERCRLAFSGVPNETRKALPDGTTIFERVLPGPDRMYPDTDSAPIPIPEQLIRDVEDALPTSLPEQIARMDAWDIPMDARRYILRRGLFETLAELIDNLGIRPSQAGALLGHAVRHISGARSVDGNALVEALQQALAQGMNADLFPQIARKVLAEGASSVPVGELLGELRVGTESMPGLLARLPELMPRFAPTKRLKRRQQSVTAAKERWLMGQLRPDAIGNVPLAKLAMAVQEAVR